MSKYAKILKIEEEQLLLGLLNDKGLCGSGTCEGCSCSTKLQTIKVKVDEDSMENRQFTTGMDVKMELPKGTALDWVLIIFVPLILVAGVSLFGKFSDENIRNLVALGAGAAGFLLSSLIVMALRKDQRVKITPLAPGETP